MLFSTSLNAGVQINFAINLAVGQVILNVYLPEEIPTYPKQISTISFELSHFEKIRKMSLFSAKNTEFAYTLIFENEVFARDWYLNVM